jgi:hypothetical protein
VSLGKRRDRLDALLSRPRSHATRFVLGERFLVVARRAQHLTLREFLMHALARPRPDAVTDLRGSIDVIELKVGGGPASNARLAAKPIRSALRLPATLVVALIGWVAIRHALPLARSTR